MAIMTLLGVKYDYGGPDVLKGISCEFERGKVHAVVGKSGSGKTTLLSLLAGLDRPRAGTIVYGDECTATDKMNLTKFRREKVAVIYQSFRLFPLMTALENVMYPMELRGIRAKTAMERAKEFILSVGLNEPLFNRFPAMLSGGEQQRVAIARALATDAKLILADEPTGNLDQANSRNIIDILVNLAHEKDYCVIIVTHDVKILDRMDVVYNMIDGLFVNEA